MMMTRVRAVVSLGRFEAAQLVRSVVVLGGLVAGGILLWVAVYRSQPLWWNGGWAIGYAQTVVSLAVLIAAQLATARSRRDGLQELYDSFPSSAMRRTIAHLTGLLGALPACLVLIGAATGVFVLHDVVGRPNIAVLVGGVLLVIAGGAIGVAIGSRFPHPLAGVLGAFVWFVPFSQSNRFNSAIVWLFPWVKPDQLNGLPGSLAGYPPAVAHAVELTAIAMLAGVVALAVTAAARRQRVALLSVAAAALAAVVVACVVQLQPIRTRDLDRLVSQAANTGSAKQCTTSDEARYCLYPEFRPLLSSLRGPVRDVLARIPTQHNRALTISQTSDLTFDDPTLTHGHSSQQVAAWKAQLEAAPSNLPSSSAIYVNLASWPARGRQSVARFDLALGAAEWAVGLPTNTGANSDPLAQCVPVNQAREAIAIWLAAEATHLPSARFPDSDGRYSVAPVDGTAVVIWFYPGEIGSYFASAGPQTTASGYLLAQAMTKLPADRVTAVLHAAWGRWIGAQTTDSQLATALGVTLPAVHLVGPRGQPITPMLRPGESPSQPLCTT